MATPRRPPGPKGHWLIGSLPLSGKDPLARYLRWARRYGDIFYYRAFNRHVYFLNHPDLIEQVLLSDFRGFTKGEVLKANRRIFGNGLLTSEGEFWLRQRRLMQPVFRQERIAAYGQVMSDYAGRMVDGWTDGAMRDIHAEMMRVTLCIAAKTLFDIDIAAEADRISNPLNTLMEIGTGGRLVLPAALRLLPTRNNLRYRKAVRQLDDVVFGLIRERRARAGDGADLLSLLVNAQADDGRRMTDRQIRDEALTLLLAGHETTAVALSWTFYLLARHPEIESRLHAELESALNGRRPSSDDIPALEYTQRVVKEAMRLYPPAWGLVRSAVRDFELSGYHVPAGSNIVMSQYVTHRDPRYFAEPEQFIPDRWLEARNVPLPRFAYFPFGGGSRICIGASFAMMESVLVLAAVAQRYRARLVPNHPVVPIPAITLRPKSGIKVILEKRTSP